MKIIPAASENMMDAMQYTPAGIVEIYELERRGCTCDDWSRVLLSPDTDTSRISHVRFEGDIRIGRLSRGLIENAHLIDITVGDEVTIRNVRGYLRGARIGNGAVLRDIGTIVVEYEASFGIGTQVAVLDETGSRPVYLHPGLSAQFAALMALRPRWSEDVAQPLLQEKWGNYKFDYDIGPEAQLSNVQYMENVHIGREVVVDGAVSLRNGAIINNAAPGRALAKVNGAVEADNFIVEDGFLGGGSYLHNVYIGQGASLDKRFTAHDSLFFANTAMENGEACAIIGAPFTVSMHKSTLLIGMQTSFMNAGSATNFSNHMYKLGPVHWGYMERGAKTSSGAYIMWGGRIGAFSLVMGAHKHHPDTSEFPFSYLFGDADGYTVVSPALMLKSCGLLRDARKWPLRDRRLKHRLPLHDNITFDVFNPLTVQTMMDAIKTLEAMEQLSVDDHGYIHYKGLLLRKNALARGRRLYKMAILRYLYTGMHAEGYTEADSDLAPAQWVDLAGQVMPYDTLQQALDHDAGELSYRLFDKAFKDYRTLELAWIRSKVESEWHTFMPEAPSAIVELDEMIEADKQAYKNSINEETSVSLSGI